MCEKNIIKPGPACAIWRASALKSNDPRSIQLEAKNMYCWKRICCSTPFWNLTQINVDNVNHAIYWTEKKVFFYTISIMWPWGDVAWTNWSYGSWVFKRWAHDHILYYAILQPTLQPTNNTSLQLNLRQSTSVDCL